MDALHCLRFKIYTSINLSMQFAQSIYEGIPLSNLVTGLQALRLPHRATKEGTRHIDAILVHVCVWLADKMQYVPSSRSRMKTLRFHSPPYTHRDVNNQLSGTHEVKIGLLDYLFGLEITNIGSILTLFG
jgi:hypothetical protein